MANIISKINASNVDYAIRAGYMYYGKTSGTTSALTVTITDTNNQIISIPELVRGMVLVLNLNVVPTESATLSVNGLPAKPIQYGVGEGGTKWSIDETYIFIYNGTAFVAISNYDNYNVTTTGSGNAITSITKDGKTITATKGSTFLTAHPTISKSTDTTSSETVQHQGSFTVVDSITRDDNGHVTKINTKTVTLPSDVGETNQNAFSNITVGSTTIAADSKTDTLTLVAGNNITLTPDATNDNITIAAADTWRPISNSVETIDSNTSASLTAVKTAYDKAVSAYNLANSKTANTGTVTSITPGTGLTGTSSDTAITTSGTINLKTASSDEIGGIKIGYTQSGKNYPVVLDSNNKAYVNVPWTDTDTNTDTKVTSAANHYSPSTDTNSALSVDASSSTAATWGTTQLVTGVNISRDSKGHVTGLTVDSIKMPANPNSDTQVTAVGNHYKPSGGSAATATASGSTLAFGDAVITGVTKDAAGHVTGVTTSKLPANPNSDTKNIVGASASATADATGLINGIIYLNHIENDRVTSSHKIVGSGTTTVIRDDNGDIVIKSPTLATVATSGKYSDLSGTPAIPDPTFAFGNSTTIDFATKRRTYNVITTTTTVNIAYSSTKKETGLEHYMLIKNNASTAIKVNFPTGTIIKSASVSIDPGSYVEISAIYIGNPTNKVVVTISDKLTAI